MLPEVLKEDWQLQCNNLNKIYADLLTQLWNREQLVATFNNLSQSMEETATPKTHTVLCSCSSSGQDSSRSTPDYYESSEGSPSNGRDIEGTREQHLHYPPNALLDLGMSTSSQINLWPV